MPLLNLQLAWKSEVESGTDSRLNFSAGRNEKSEEKSPTQSLKDGPNKTLAVSGKASALSRATYFVNIFAVLGDGQEKSVRDAHQY